MSLVEELAELCVLVFLADFALAPASGRSFSGLL